MTKHSKLGASSAKRWINCPGSVALIGDGHDKDSHTEYSARGDAAHFAAGDILEGNADLWEMNERKFSYDDISVTLDLEDCAAIQVYLTRCENLRMASTKHWIEFSFDLREYHPDFYGTLDFASLSGEFLDCVDYKHGVGVYVPIDWNEQLMYYALGIYIKALSEKERNRVKTIRLAIVQPRIIGYPAVRVWEISKEDLLAWFEGTLIPAAKRTEDPDAPLVFGDWCRDTFCKARNKCPAHGSLAQELAVDTDLNTKAFSNEDIAMYLDYAEVLKPFFADLNVEAYMRMTHGQTVPGRKLVKGKVNRVWKDGALAELLKHYKKSELYGEPKMIGIPAVGKLPGGKALVTKWAYSPEAKLTMVPESDPKPAVTRSAVDAFAGIEE